ncbi:MAG: hypothetical protein Q9218_003450 [Villophora microphyllina]
MTNMPVFWVQHWSYLPVIVEDIDTINGRPSGNRLPLTQLPAHHILPSHDKSHSLVTSRSRGNTSFQPFLPQELDFQSLLAAGLTPNMPGQQPSTYGPGRGQAEGAFSMSGLGDALPRSIPPQDEVEQSTSVSGSSATLHAQSPSPFAGQTPLGSAGYGMYSTPYATPYQQAAANAQAYSHAQLNQPSHNIGPGPIQPPYPSQPYFPNQQQQPYLLYPGQYGQPGQTQQALQTYGQPFPRGSNQAFGPGMMPQVPDPAGMQLRTSQYGGYTSCGPLGYGYGSGQGFARSDMISGSRGAGPKLAPGPIPSSPRGPPRKPKQSGHALWVGNLPSGARISDLKDHFSQEATTTIESVFLISKSNCAFVNYRTDEACAAAMSRFHDSRFQGVRLVCRLRKSAAAPVTGVPTGPASLMPAIAASQSAIESIRQNREVSSRAEAMASAESTEHGQNLAKGLDKFFIMKSLTVEDMELSVRNSIWATQAHNEEALNKAFDTVENVYLIFSANKSGEYFGYARMASPITEEVAASLDWAPKPGVVIDDPELPRAIPTTKTEWAPKGHIIDDSARGTIFWEADPEDVDIAPIIDGEVAERAEEDEPTDVAEEGDEAAEQSGAQAFGKPFKIEWLATNRLPFYRTRGLRNPWNANREVKIARDGTELETSVGRRLLQMFHRAGPEAYGDVFTFILLGKKTTVFLGTKGNEFILNGKLKDANAEEIYSPLTTPVFGAGVVYDCPNAKLMEQKKVTTKASGAVSFVKFGLTSESLRSYVPLIENEVIEFVKRVPSLQGAKGTVNIPAVMAEMTIYTASRSLQGKEVRSRFDSSFADLYHDLDMGFSPINFMLPWAPLPHNKKRDHAQKKMAQTYTEIIKARREAGGERDSDDMIWNLMSCVYKDGTPVPDVEVAHMMIALLMAGQHSSSSTSAWIMLRLATRPDILEELYQEQITVLGTDANGDLPPLTYDMLQILPLNAQVVKETLRIHAPIHSMMRKVTNALPIEGTPYTIPTSHVLLAAPGVTSKTDEHFPNSSEWEPHRWDAGTSSMSKLEESEEKVDYGYGLVSKGASSPYLPFGAGRHRCIGEAFAYVQLGTITATMVREFRLRNLEGVEGVVGTDYSPSAGDDDLDSKKVRRSDRISSQNQTTPLKNKSFLPSPLTHQESTATEDYKEATASPTEGRPSQINHRSPISSPPLNTQGLSSPPLDTQPFSQFVYPPTAFPLDEGYEEAEGVWGYLVPVDNIFGNTLILKKRTACPAPYPEDTFGQGSEKRAKGCGSRNFIKEEKDYEKTKRDLGFPAGGYLVGRHPECDRVLELPTISNRHCIVFSENKHGKLVAIIEDLSSNGTFVNEVILGRNKRHELEDGDQISILDEARFTFRYPLSRDGNAFRLQFRILQQLGKGHFATVYLCVERATGTQFAVKRFEKRPGDSQSKTDGLQQEIGVLKAISHPNVLCLQETFDEDDGVYIVLELAPEGELFNTIVMKQKLSEEESRSVFIQLFQGIKYLHERNIVHRDIKPENILLADKDLSVKIADFGLAKIIGEESFTTTLCGTPSYVAPEILENSKHRKYTRAVDVWSLGVVLYICLCGFPPFSDELYTRENPYNLSQQIKMGRFDYPSPYWDSVGDPALDLIDRMLTVDIDKRITIDECLEHPWITLRGMNPADSTDGLTGAMDNLDFSKRKMARERTLLSSVNDIKVSKVLELENLQVPIKVFDKNPDGKKTPATPESKNKKNGVATTNGAAGNKMREEETPAQNRQTEAFMGLGGKGDPPLFEDDHSSRYAKKEVPK